MVIYSFFADELLAEHAFHDKSHRARRKSGDAGDIRARQRRVLPDSVEHQSLIALAQRGLTQCPAGCECHVSHGKDTRDALFCQFSSAKACSGTRSSSLTRNPLVKKVNRIRPAPHHTMPTHFAVPDRFRKTYKQTRNPPKGSRKLWSIALRPRSRSRMR